MDLTDRVLNLDWSNAEHAGHGVFVMDATRLTGVPSLAVREDRGEKHHVILLEGTIFKNLTRYGKMLLDRQDETRQAGIVTHAIHPIHPMHANPAFGCEMYRCPPTCQYADPGPGPDRIPAGMKHENGDEQRANVSESER